jgi:hypothetical protein
MITLLIILLFIILIYIIISNKICNSELKYYIYDTKIEGKTILLLGGTHGNEPAGTESIKDFQKELNNKNIILNRGKLILIPEVNYCALKLGLRLIPFIGDMNRKYPYKLNEKINNNIIKKIIELISISDFVIDFHEGWGFNRINKKSLGSTITPSTTNESMQMSKIILKELNKTIQDKDKKFTILTKIKFNNEEYDYNESIDIKGSLRYYMNIINKNYILVETTGQDNIQKLDIRMKQNKIIIDNVLKQYNII